VAFLQLPAINSIVVCSIACCSLDHKEANSSVASFMTELVSSARDREVRLQSLLLFTLCYISLHFFTIATFLTIVTFLFLSKSELLTSCRPTKYSPTVEIEIEANETVGDKKARGLFHEELLSCISS